MKKLMVVALIAFVGISMSAEAKHEYPVKVLSAQLDVVYLKVSCSMIGGEIAIFNEQGVMIFHSMVKERKMIVDFYAEPSGVYHIKLMNANVADEVTYTKSTESAAVDQASQQIVVSQG